MKRSYSIAVIMLTVVATSGCSIFSRPDNQFYSLETIDGTRRQISGAPIGLDGVELPPGFDRRGLLLRDEDHRIEVRGTHQWTSPLEEMVIHTLAFDLAKRLPEGIVVLPGQAKPLGPMRSVHVVFEDFAAGPDPVVRLAAQWTVAAEGTSMVSQESIEVPLQSLDSSVIAEGMSTALAELADRIADRLVIGD